MLLVYYLIAQTFSFFIIPHFKLKLDPLVTSVFLSPLLPCSDALWNLPLTTSPLLVFWFNCGFFCLPESLYTYLSISFLFFLSFSFSFSISSSLCVCVYVCVCAYIYVCVFNGEGIIVCMYLVYINNNLHCPS